MEQQVTKINRGWMIKMLIYCAAMTGLGIWGLVDGAWIYPKRGRESASYREKEYLEQAQNAGRLLTASVADPAAERRRLSEAERSLRADAEKKSGQTSLDAAADLSRLEWLTALSRINRLDKEHTQFADPVKRLGELQQEWQAKKAPVPLSAYDIPAQWVICAGGLGAGAYILFLISKVSTKRFRYDPASMRLTLPGGVSFEPKDIRELDKRKWDKFFVTVVLKDGRQEKLDLLRHSPLEEWILEMEKKTDSYVPPPPAETPQAAPAEPAGSQV